MSQWPSAPAVPNQAIIAENGARIAHVAQTIVYGDLHSGPRPTEADLADLYTRYRAFVVESFGALDFRGIMQLQPATRLSLDQIYVPLAGRLRMPESPTAEAHDLIRETPLLVVLGHPGSGKSTLVRYILLALAREQAAERLGLAPGHLPIYFPIAAFAAARAAPGRADIAPLDYLCEYYRGLSQPDYGPLFARALAQGSALLLLDGLDEVRDGRRQIVDCIEALVREWDARGNRFLVTSRIVGYDDAPLSPALFAVAELLPLDDARIHSFVERWSTAYEALAEPAWPAEGDLLADLVRETVQDELQRRSARHAELLSAAIFGDPRVTDLARNPLLLTILALIHNQGARLPDRRVELYRLCVSALAETWNRARSLSGRSVDLHLDGEPIDERFVVNLLGPVALWIHGNQPGGLVEAADLEARIAATLGRAEGLPHGRARRRARQFIELMRRDTGLLQERGFRRFGFLHLTFEEYLAARGLLESAAVDDPDQLIQSYALDPRWHEVIRLAIGAAPQREAQRLLLCLLDTPVEGGPGRGRPALIAGECLLDLGRAAATGRAWTAVRSALLDLLADSQLPVATRVEAGALLGRQGDPRRFDLDSGQAAGQPAAPSPWCTVAAGPFWRGDERAPGARPLALADLPRGFEIARYPVTNAEYARFIADGGYAQPRWWTAAGQAFLARQAPESAAGPIRRPALWESAPYNGPAQPVVGVSWYEAAAFCAWLTDVGRRRGWLGRGELLRLPTAHEWERSARHTDRRAYPWGDEPPDATRASFNALSLRAPAPVGCFPAGAAACGALDMAGNVWEWTASAADDLADPAPRADFAPDLLPAIKGGAFNWDADALRCGAHYWFSPGQRYNLLGFRIVRVDADLPQGAA